MSRIFVFAIISFCMIMIGCAEGPLWQTGKYSPWARDKWAAEEQIADTLFERKRVMSESVARVQGGQLDSQQKVADELAKIVQREPILLLRLHAVRLLGDLAGPAAANGLELAAKDPDADVRVAAIRSLSRMPDEIAIPQLQEIVGSDTNIDVRLAATKALGNFSGRSTIEALSYALSDRDPALQMRATESLGKTTGEDFGPNVAAWKNYVQKFSGANQVLTADASSNDDETVFK